jgi:hypothetical protein
VGFTLRWQLKVNVPWTLYCLVHNIEKLARHQHSGKRKRDDAKADQNLRRPLYTPCSVARTPAAAVSRLLKAQCRVSRCGGLFIRSRYASLVFTRKVGTMIKTIVLVITSVVSSWGFAAGPMVVAMSRSAPPVSIRIEAPANYIVVPVSISSDDKDPLRGADNIQATKGKLTEAAAKSSTIKVRHGVQSLSVSEQGSAFSSSSPASTPPTADTYIIAPLGQDKDVYQATREIRGFLRSIAKPDQVRLRLGATALGVDDPEQYRPRLLPIIAKEVERTRVAIGKSRSYEVSGLESPVLVAQQDERNVVVFIPFKLKVGE